MSELRGIRDFSDSRLSRGRVVLSDAEGDIRLVYRDGALYLHDKEPVKAYVEREVLPRVEGLRDSVEDDHNKLTSLEADHERDVRELTELIHKGDAGYRELELSMPLDKIVDGRLMRYTGRHGDYEAGDVLKGFEGVTYDITLGDVLRSSLLCLDADEWGPFGGVFRLEAKLVSGDGSERRYLALSRYKPEFLWERISPGGKDRTGERDSEWARSWLGKPYAEYTPAALYDGTEFRCCMRKYDALLVYVSAKLRGGIEI